MSCMTELLNVTKVSAEVNNMCRCVLSMMLLPYVLLTQFALVGHTHDERFPLGHSLRPHIHTGTGAYGINHHHGDHGPAEHHHHDETDDVIPRGMTSSDTFPDHALDTIYLAAFDYVPSDRKVDSVESLGTGLLAIPSSKCSELALEVAAMCLVMHHPPLPRSCSIYIRNLAILI